MPNWCAPQVPPNVSVMALQGCKISPQKSRPLESGHNDRRYGVWVDIEYSYKQAKKMNLNFSAN